MDYITYTGELCPGDPTACPGNGSTPAPEGGVYECCCDECDHFLDCYPQYLPNP